MKILSLETTGRYASVAINVDEQIYELKSESEMNSLKEITLLIENLSKKSKTLINDIDAVAVSIGPGSFTGIRIGISTARAIAQGLNIPCIPVNTLESFLYEERSEISNSIICPIFNARRNQIYSGAYNSSDNVAIINSGAYMIDSFLKRLKEKMIKDYKEYDIIIYGDGIDFYKEFVEEFSKEMSNNDIRCILENGEKRYQTASNVLNFGIDLFNQGKSVSYNYVLPNYMREAEAQRNLCEDKRIALEKIVEKNTL